MPHSLFLKVIWLVVVISMCESGWWPYLVIKKMVYFVHKWILSNNLWLCLLLCQEIVLSNNQWVWIHHHLECVCFSLCWGVLSLNTEPTFKTLISLHMPSSGSHWRKDTRKDSTEIKYSSGVLTIWRSILFHSFIAMRPGQIFEYWYLHLQKRRW